MKNFRIQFALCAVFISAMLGCNDTHRADKSSPSQPEVQGTLPVPSTEEDTVAKLNEKTDSDLDTDDTEPEVTSDAESEKPYTLPVNEDDYLIWPRELRKAMVDSYTEGNFSSNAKFSTPALSTVKAFFTMSTNTPNIHVRGITLKSQVLNKTVPVEFEKSPEEFIPAKAVKATYKIQKGKAAPLTVILPGMFQSAQRENLVEIWNLHRAPRHMMALVYAQGHHVAVLPNSFSRDYINALAGRSAPGYIGQEGYVTLTLVNDLVQKLKKKKVEITEVRLLGVSYGANVAVAAKAMDMLSGLGLISGNVTAFNPHFDMIETSLNLDTMMNSESYTRYTDLTDLGSEVQKLAKQIEKANSENDFNQLKIKVTRKIEYKDKKGRTKTRKEEVDESSSEYMEGLLARFFNRQLNRALKNQLNGNRAYNEFLAKNGLTKGTELRYEHYRKSLLNESTHPEYGTLNYWLDSITDNSVRVISTRDDLFNPNSVDVISKSLSYYSHANTFLIDMGGHTGYMDINSDAFKSLVKAVCQ